MRAKHEYGRIVEGCRAIEKENELYFITITCRGRTLSVEEAIEGYLKWTNRLLTTWRANAKKRGVLWQYAQVTEWQKRGHPHSHILTTYFPADLIDGYKLTQSRLANGMVSNEETPALRSAYMLKTVKRAGLGDQYDISQVFTVEGASRYVAKYLFKTTMFSREYPERWHRVRYSQSFPRAVQQSNREAFPLLSRSDWQLLARTALIVACEGTVCINEAEYYLNGSDCILRLT